MADPVEQPIVPAVSAVAPETSPVIPANPEPAAPVHPDQAAAVIPAPDVSVISSPDASGEVAKTSESAEGFKPTLLDSLDKPKEEKPVEVKAEDAPKPEGEAKPEEPKVEDAPKAELPKIDYFADEVGVKLPDTMKMDDAQRGELSAALDAFRADPTKGAQQIIDIGSKVITDYAEQLRRDQWTVFNDTQTDWQSKVMADPILGGAGHDTAMILVGQGRNKLVSTHPVGSEGFTEDMKAFNEFARITGAGNHPVLLRILHRAGKLFAEAAPPPPDPRPTPDNGRRPKAKGDIYPNTKFPNQA